MIFFIISILWWKNLDANLPYFCHIFLIFIIIFYIFQFIFFLYKFASKFFVITRSSLLQIQIFKSYEIVFYTLFTLYIIHYWVIILLNTDLCKSTFPIISQDWVFCALVFRVSLSLVFSFSVQCFQFNVIEVVYVTIENSAFCLALYLIGVHFSRRVTALLSRGWGKKIKCRPIRTREIGGFKLQKELYSSHKILQKHWLKRKHQNVSYSKCG